MNHTLLKHEPETRYTDPWVGKDGRSYRTAKYWNGFGFQSFLQVEIEDDLGNYTWTGI